MGSDFAYAAWRFSMWSAGIGSYEEIERLVSEGIIRPGMSADEAKAATLRAGDKPDGAT